MKYCSSSNAGGAAFLWGRELVFTGSKLFVFTSYYWRRLIFLQLTTCDHEFTGMFRDSFCSRVYGEHEFTTPKERSINVHRFSESEF